VLCDDRQLRFHFGGVRQGLDALSNVVLKKLIEFQRARHAVERGVDTIKRTTRIPLVICNLNRAGRIHCVTSSTGCTEPSRVTR